MSKTSNKMEDDLEFVYTASSFSSRPPSSAHMLQQSTTTLFDFPISTTSIFESRCKLGRFEHQKVEQEYDADSKDVDTKDFPWDDLELPGTWGQHGVEKYPWSDYDRPFIQLSRYVDLELTEEEMYGTLTDRVIGSCLSYLDRCPEIGDFALLKCQLMKKGLKKISALQYYHYIQYLDLANNRISDITCLGQLPFLMYLDVSCNELTSVLPFKAPFFLTYVNYSHNMVDEIGDLAAFWSIVYLDLSYNMIYEISGLKQLKYLRHLNLSYNEIECLENLDHLKLQTLHLQHNAIFRFSEGEDVGLKTNNHLCFIDLSCNKLKTLQLFEEANAIEEIDMSGNSIDSLFELNYLRDLNRLVKVDFNDNPIAQLKDYYNACLFILRSLCVLDSNLIEASEKVQARAKYNEFQPLIEAKKSMRLTMLQHLNLSIIDESVVPVDQPPPPVIILVGLPGSKKGLFIKEFCKKYPKFTKLGVSYTTRQNWEEQEGVDYFFISREEFINMMKKGEFLTVSEFLGNCYGFAQSELAKVSNKKKVLIFHTDLSSALILRRKGLKPRFVMAMPSTEQIHEEWLREKYTYSSYQPLQTLGGLLIENNPNSEQQTHLISSMKRMHHEQIVKKIVDDVVKKATEPPVVPHQGSGHKCSIDEQSGDEIFPLMSPSFHGDRSILKRRVSIKSSITDFFSIQSARSVTFKIENDWDDTSLENLPTSISQTVMHSNSGNFGQLSVLSSATITHLGKRMSGIASKTSADSDEAIPTEKQKEKSDPQLTDILFKDVLDSREMYLEFHRENPGLFCEVIHTDKVEEAMQKLHKVLKTCVQNQNKSIPVYDFQKDSVYKNMTRTRLNQMFGDMNKAMGIREKITNCELHSVNQKRNLFAFSSTELGKSFDEPDVSGTNFGRVSRGDSVGLLFDI